MNPTDDPFPFPWEWRPDSPEPTKQQLVECLQMASWLLWDECTENDEYENTRLGGVSRSQFFEEWVPKNVKDWVLTGDESAVDGAAIAFDEWAGKQQ